MKYNRYGKREIKGMVKSAHKLASECVGVIICFPVYAGGTYVLDTEEDNIIELCITEEEAANCIKGINEEVGKNAGCYYKPRLIDEDTGEWITRNNLDSYKI